MDYPSDPKYLLTGGVFTEGDPSLPVPASILPAAWMNAITDEILAVITDAGLTPDEADVDQLLEAIDAKIASALGGGSIAVLNEGGSPSIQSGLAGSRPAPDALKIGRLYISTDTKIIERDTGSAWELLFGITGSITANGYAKFASASGVTLIMQWVTLTPVPPLATTVVALPIAFPTAVFGCVVNTTPTGSEDAVLKASATLSQVSIENGRNFQVSAGFVIALGI